MADLKRNQIRAVEEAMAYPRGFGYVLDFSDRTMEEFFADEFGIEIYAEEYQVNGSSKRNCLTTFLESTDTYNALRVLRALWDRREGLLENAYDSPQVIDAKQKTSQFRKVIDDLETAPDAVSTEGVDTFTRDRTLEELVADIERTVAADKPEVAIDHLHTYCVKKFTHLLSVRGIECTNDEPLHSRFGKYRKCLEQERELHEFTIRALKSFISLFDSFNDLRNNRSLAHDNVLLEPVEARLIVNTINSMLVFLRALESSRYGE
jgi:hypothetical protein